MGTLSRDPYGKISDYATVIVGVDITRIKQRLSSGGAFDRRASRMRRRRSGISTRVTST